MKKITIAEDDIYLREELILTFKRKGYSVTGISSFVTPEEEISTSKPDLLVLDLNLPGKSGFELCRHLKRKSNFPILILTARDTLSDELKAIGFGADDYLTKPCHPKRLLARADRLLQAYDKVKGQIRCGSISLDADTYKVMYADTHIILPETEGKLLQKLMEEYPQLVSQSELFVAVWGTQKYVDENILQVNMTRLRRHLDGAGLRDCVVTVRGKGYYLEVESL